MKLLMAVTLWLLLALLWISFPALGQGPEETATPVATPNRTALKAAQYTPTIVNTPAAPDEASHVHVLEMTILPKAPDDRYASLCVDKGYDPKDDPSICRCVSWFTRTGGGTHAWHVKCPDGVDHTVHSW